MAASKKMAIEVPALFAVIYQDNEVFGVYASLDLATEAATEELSEGVIDSENLIVCKMTPVRIVKASQVVVEDIA